jgi:hypothetical protein
MRGDAGIGLAKSFPNSWLAGERPMGTAGIAGVHTLKEIIDIISPFAEALVETSTVPKLLEFCAHSSPKCFRPIFFDIIGIVFDSLMRAKQDINRVKVNSASWDELARMIILRAAIISKQSKFGTANQSLLRCALVACTYMQYDEYTVSKCANNITDAALPNMHSRAPNEVEATRCSRFMAKSHLANIELGFGVTEKLVVSWVDPTSNAFVNGLRAEHIIKKVNDIPCSNFSEFKTILCSDQTRYILTLDGFAARRSSVPDAQLLDLLSNTKLIIGNFLSQPTTLSSVSIMTNPSQNVWNVVKSSDLLTCGSYSWEVKITDIIRVVDVNGEDAMKLQCGVVQANLPVSESEPVLWGIQLLSTNTRTLLSTLIGGAVMQSYDCVLLPMLCNGDTLGINFTFKNFTTAQHAVFGFDVSFNHCIVTHIDIDVHDWPKQSTHHRTASLPFLAANPVVAVFKNKCRATIRPAVPLECMSMTSDENLTRQQLIRIRDTDSWLNRSASALAEIVHIAELLKRPFSAFCSKRDKNKSMLQNGRFGMFERMVRKHLLCKEEVSMKYPIDNKEHVEVISMANAELVSLSPFGYGKHPAEICKHPAVVVYMDIPTNRIKGEYQSIQLNNRISQPSVAENVILKKDYWNPDLSYNNGSGFSFGETTVTRTTDDGPDYFLAIGSNQFGEGDKVTIKMNILMRQTNMYIGIGDPTAIDLGSGLQSSTLVNRVWYMRYGGAVRSGDHEYFTYSRYTTGTKLNILFDATSEPWKIAFQVNDENPCDQIEMSLKEPSHPLHVVACLDDADDSVEIEDIIYHSRKNKTGSMHNAACQHLVPSNITFLACGSPVVRGPGWT